jgi:hypothetical protein
MTRASIGTAPRGLPSRAVSASRRPRSANRRAGISGYSAAIAGRTTARQALPPSHVARSIAAARAVATGTAPAIGPDGCGSVIADPRLWVFPGAPEPCQGVGAPRAAASADVRLATAPNRIRR